MHTEGCARVALQELYKVALVGALQLEMNQHLEFWRTTCCQNFGGAWFTKQLSWISFLLIAIEVLQY
jgi:hypothetical protein